MTWRAATIEEAREAMGIEWMNWREMAQAIPPVYTEWIGKQLMRVFTTRMPTRGTP